jgi:hypothetical protein
LPTTSEAVGLDRPPGGADVLAHGDDPIAVHGDVGAASGHPRAVDDRSATNHQVMHREPPCRRTT